MAVFVLGISIEKTKKYTSKWNKQWYNNLEGTQICLML